MFEIKFDDEKINLEKSIENSKKKTFKSKFFLTKKLMYLLLTVIAIHTFTLVWPFNGSVINIIKNVSTAVGGIGIFNYFVNSYHLLRNIKTKKEKEKAKSVLDDVSKVLNKNNVNTNSRELSNSVILKNSVVSFEEKSEDGIVNYYEENVFDNYYFFLDKNNNTAGLLEKNIENISNDQTSFERKFYVLEDEDISRLEHKVVKTKKLVRRPNNN